MNSSEVVRKWEEMAWGIAKKWEDMTSEEEEEEFERLKLPEEVEFGSAPGEIELTLSSRAFHETLDKLILVAICILT